ncbi:hypothetical protein HAX54_014735 [Datura stramonium]|uniref:Uncharacterized protein n=1 Tax=Datura stramonium TaxID=4076 RepID=A0ABS8TNH8_DATST|nr:hypothetical protein [Datura stramonium]
MQLEGLSEIILNAARRAEVAEIVAATAARNRQNPLRVYGDKPFFSSYLRPGVEQFGSSQALNFEVMGSNPVSRIDSPYQKEGPEGERTGHPSQKFVLYNVISEFQYFEFNCLGLPLQNLTNHVPGEEVIERVLNNTPFVLNEDCLNDFEELKKMLFPVPVFATPEWNQFE